MGAAVLTHERAVVGDGKKMCVDERREHRVANCLVHGYARLCHDFHEKRQSGVTKKEWIVAEREFDSEEQHLGVIVWENSFARIPLPRTLFCGDYDERYGVNDKGIVTRQYAGKGVIDYESLMADQSLPITPR